MQSRLLVLLPLAFLLLSSCRMLERSFLYRPSSAEIRAESWQLPAESVKLLTPDGETLDGWWVPNSNGGGPVVLLLPGRRGFRSRHVANLRVMWKAGASVLVLQYRGFGDSTGSPTEEGLIMDGTTAFDWLRGRVGDRPIVVLGRSLGGAVAAQVALRRDVAGLVLESAFTSVPDMARKMVDIPGIEYIVATDFDTVDALHRIDVPVVIIHGTDDTLVPIEMGHALLEAARSPQKRFYEVRGASHWNTYYLAGNVYRDWLSSMEHSNCETRVC
jgi:fermentation-respiration switch protein FrsA (DUF1100 family)